MTPNPKHGQLVYWKRGSRYYAAKYLWGYPDWKAVRILLGGRERVVADNEVVSEDERDQVQADGARRRFRERWGTLLRLINEHPNVSGVAMSSLFFGVKGQYLPAGAIWHVRCKAERLGLLPLNLGEHGAQKNG